LIGGYLFGETLVWASGPSSVLERWESVGVFRWRLWMGALLIAQTPGPKRGTVRELLLDFDRPRRISLDC
jgi:hypothetical protein